MTLSNRGWTGGTNAKPAAALDIRYGSGLLKRDSAHWPRYGIVTSPSALSAARPSLTRQPEGIAHAQWLDSQHQRDLSRQLPDDIELVVGLGGGTALDASKFVALDKAVPLILVPTIASTGAIIHGVVANWEGRKIIGSAADWPWVDCDYVLVDTNVLLAAPHYLNTAGLGDILCIYAGVAEWSWRAQQKSGPPLDGEAAADLEEYLENLVRGFEQSLDQEGNLTAASVEHIVSSLQQRDGRALPAAAASGDHPFWLALEQLHDRSWVHGELVALGALMIAWQSQVAPQKLVHWLERCRVRVRPAAIGLSREQLRRGLAFVPGYMVERNIDSVLRHQPITGARFDELWTYLESV